MKRQPCIFLTLALAQGAIAAPQAIINDPFCLTEASALVSNAAGELSEEDLGNTGLNWGNTLQDSFATVWMNPSDGSDAFGATEGEKWDTGFSAWAYARAMGTAGPGAIADAHCTSMFEVPMEIDEVSRLKGSICLMGHASIPGTYVDCMIQRVDVEGSEMEILENLLVVSCEPDQQPCPMNCIEFDIFVEPGQYRFWGIARADVQHAAAGHLEAWAEYSMELDIQGLPEPDLDGDGDVDGGDLAIFLGGWGGTDMTLDFNGDSQVNGQDLAILLCEWTL